MEEIHYPNKHHGLWRYFNPAPASPLEMQAALDLEKVRCE